MTKFNFPELRQFYLYDCGAVAMQGILAYYGMDVPNLIIMKIAKTNPKIGTSIEGLKKVANKFGLKYKEGKMNISKLRGYIRKKIPVIILIEDIWILHNLKNYDYYKQKNFGHYVIPVGFNKEKIFFEDPASCFRTYLTYGELEKMWKVVRSKRKKLEKIEHYGIAFYGKEPVYKETEVIHMGFNSQNKHFPTKYEKF